MVLRRRQDDRDGRRLDRHVDQRQDDGRARQLDGETPNPATPLGQVIPVGLAPQFFPFAADVKVCSDVAGNSELNVLYTS
jgi:hypothetical protein